MNQLIYLIYPILLILFLKGAKFSKHGAFNEEVLSLEQTKYLQGFFAVCIMLHHIGQKTCASWLPKTLIIPGLEPFVPIGYYFVGFFLFCTGYGLYKSKKNKENYFKGYFRKRVLPLIAAYYITGFVFFIARLIVGEKMDTMQKIYYLTGLKLCNPNTWYVIVVPFFYLGFWIAFKLIKKESLSLLFITLFMFGYMLLGTLIDHNNFWMRGEWWYNSAHMFLIGIFFAKFEKKIIDHFKKYYIIYIIVLFFACFLTYGFSVYAQNRFSYYGENWGAPDKVGRRWVCLISQQLASLTFVLFFIVLTLKIKIGNAFLRFMGKITLEFYLIHGLFLELLAYSFDGVAPSLYYMKNVPLLVCIVFTLAIPSALLLQKVLNLICRKK